MTAFGWPRRKLWGTVALLVALVVPVAVGRTGADFSSTAGNAGNSFSAATSFSSGASSAVAKSSAVTTSYSSTILADNPIAYWRLDEDAGATTGVDASGSGRTLTFPSGSVPTRGQAAAVGAGQAMRWSDQTSGNATTPYASPLALNGAFSFELWLRVDGLSATRDLMWQGSGWLVRYEPNGEIEMFRDGAYTSSNAGVLTPGVYRHIVMTADGTNFRWYVDGVLNRQIAGSYPTNSTTAQVSLGQPQPSGQTAYADEIALYATALSATKVNDHFRKGKMLFADPCAQYRVYANVSGTGITSVTADLSAITASGSAVPLTAGSYTVGGVDYGYRSAPLRVAVQPGSYAYSLTYVDGGGSHTETGLTATVDAQVPMTAQFVTGFEYGATSTPSLTSAFSGVPQVTATRSRSGTRAIELNQAAGTETEYIAKDGFTTTTTLSFAVLFRSALPAADVGSIAYLNSSSTPLYLGYQAATQKLTLRWGSNTAVVAAQAIALDTWYVVDLKVDVSASPNTAAWRVDGVDQPSTNLSAAAQTVTDFRFGTAFTADGFTVHFDDIVHSQSLFDYPMGGPRVLPLLPNGMGASNTPTNFREAGGAAITSTSWTRLADATLNGGGSIEQHLVGGTSYLELTVADTTEVCVQGTQAVFSFRRQGTSTNFLKTSVFSGTTESVVYSGDGLSSTSYINRTALIPPVTTPWSQSELNALVFRIGYSTDVSPVPAWQGLLLEFASSP